MDKITAAVLLTLISPNTPLVVAGPMPQVIPNYVTPQQSPQAALVQQTATHTLAQTLTIMPAGKPAVNSLQAAKPATRMASKHTENPQWNVRATHNGKSSDLQPDTHQEQAQLKIKEDSLVQSSGTSRFKPKF